MDAARLARAYRAGDIIPPGVAVKAHASLSGHVVKATAAADKILGVSAWEPSLSGAGDAAIGDVVDVCVAGWTRIAVGSAAIAVGDFITADASGKAAVAAAGNRVIGVAQEAATTPANGGFVEILLTHATA